MAVIKKMRGNKFWEGCREKGLENACELLVEM